MMLSHSALTVAARLLEGVVSAEALIRRGDETQGRALLARLASEVMAELPVIRGVLAAQTDAAERGQLAQWTPKGPLPLRERPEKHAHAAHPVAANENHLTTPEQPGGNLA